MQHNLTLNMPISEAMETQRAIRRLKPDPVDNALVIRLIELALKAPSGSNAQNWEFIIVKDPVVKKKIAKLNRQVVKLAGRYGRSDDPQRMKTWKAVLWQAEHFEEIPVIVVACLKGRRFPFLHILRASYFGSIFPSIQNLLLAARAANLGATLITFPLWNLFSLRRALSLPRSITPCAVIPMGWPMGRYGPTTRRPVHEVVSYDRYGNRRARK